MSAATCKQSQGTSPEINYLIKKPPHSAFLAFCDWFLQLTGKQSSIIWLLEHTAASKAAAFQQTLQPAVHWRGQARSGGCAQSEPTTPSTGQAQPSVNQTRAHLAAPHLFCTTATQSPTSPSYGGTRIMKPIFVCFISNKTTGIEF